MQNNKKGSEKDEQTFCHGRGYSNGSTCNEKVRGYVHGCRLPMPNIGAIGTGAEASIVADAVLGDLPATIDNQRI